MQTLSTDLVILFRQLAHLQEIEIRCRHPVEIKKDAEMVEPWFKKHLRDGKTLLGRILTDLPSVDICILQWQILYHDRWERRIDRGKMDTNNDAADTDNRSGGLCATGSRESGVSQRNTSQSSKNTGNNGRKW